MNIIKEVTLFECSDGSTFDNKPAAEKYINLCNNIDEITHKYLKTGKIAEGVNYIQQNKEDVETFIYEICCAAAVYLPSHCDYFNKFYNKEISMQQLLDSLGYPNDIKTINKALYIINCISNVTYKQYNEPYLTKADARHVYIKGDSYNCEKIIKYLESLGGKNDCYYNIDDGYHDVYYFINSELIISVATSAFDIPSSYHEIELPKYLNF